MRLMRLLDGHGTCRFCGKRKYDSRDEAKQAAKRLAGHRLNAYRCALTPTWEHQWWHLGTLPKIVREGRMSRHNILPPQGRRQ